MHYVQREKSLKLLTDAFIEPDVNEGASRVVLVHGLPGSGKTQFARHFVELWVKRHKTAYWFDASSLGQLHTSFREFAHKAGILELPGSSQSSVPDMAFNAQYRYPDSVVVEKVKEYIGGFPQKWLLVYDNYGEEEFGIRRYFPQSHHGHVIVTSRTRKFSSSTGGKTVLVDSMSVDEAVHLLEMSANLERDPKDTTVEQVETDIVSNLLGCLPLAIAQAGALIQNEPRGDTLGPVERLRKFEMQYKEHEAAMFDEESVVQEYGKSVVTTFDGLFKVVLQRNRLAAELLLLLGFLHHTNISRELFQTVYHALDKLSMHDGFDISEESYTLVCQILSTTTGGEWDCKKFDDAMGLLDRFSLVRKVDEFKYNIHPLVHSWTRVCKIGQQTTSLEARARLAIAMLIKTHDTKLDRFSEQRKLLQPKFINHMESCIRSTQRYTKLLDPNEAPTLQASTILAIHGMLQYYTLSREHKEQQLLPNINLLALTNGSRLAGLDDLSTLDALRAVVAELPTILPECTKFFRGLFHMAFKLLPIATSKHQDSELPCAHLRWLVTQILVFAITQEPQWFDAGVREVITYSNYHRNNIDKASYFRFKSIVLGMPTPTGSDNSKTLSFIGDYLLECEEHLGSSHYYATNATLGKAFNLCELGKLSEAAEVYRSIIELCRRQPERRNLVTQALTGLKLVLILQKSSSLYDKTRTSSFSLELEKEELGDFHEDVLQRKLELLRWEGEAEEEPNQLRLNYASIFDEGDGMNDKIINTTLKLAIMYKIFEKQGDVPVFGRELSRNQNLKS